MNKSNPEAGSVDWRCFHCGDVFTRESDARLHFGRDEGVTPACIIKGADGGLLRALRDAEEEADNAYQAIHAESTDAARHYHQQRCRHNQALIAAEEAGYERGLADHQALINSLFPAIEHGDDEHRAWLKEAIEAHFNCLPIPAGSLRKAPGATVNAHSHPQASVTERPLP